MYRSVFHRRWQVILYLDHVRRRWNFHLHGCGGELLLLLLVVQCRKLAQGGLRRALLKRTIRFDICLSVYPTQRVWQHESIALFARTQTCGAIPRIVRIDQNRAYTFIYTIYICIWCLTNLWTNIRLNVVFGFEYAMYLYGIFGNPPPPRIPVSTQIFGFGNPWQPTTYISFSCIFSIFSGRSHPNSMHFFWLRRQVDPFEKP